MTGLHFNARDRKIGLFEPAREGSIFLDEIVDISLAVHAMLPKVIENQTRRRIERFSDIPVQAGIIAATGVAPPRFCKFRLLSWIGSRMMRMVSSWKEPSQSHARLDQNDVTIEHRIGRHLKSKGLPGTVQS